jgi:hypothetical protein
VILEVAKMFNGNGWRNQSGVIRQAIGFLTERRDDGIVVSNDVVNIDVTRWQRKKLIDT